MRNSIVFLFALISFAACDLTKLEPAQKQAFMKYFGDLGDTRGADLLKLNDGYLLLGNNLNGVNSTVLLIKTDLQGNTNWVETHPDFVGSSLAKSDDGYFIIGDGIDGNNPTTMLLIKTNLQGQETARASLNNADSDFHGTGLTISSQNEIVICGYEHPTNEIDADSTFLYGYTSDLVPNWTSVRKWGTEGSRVSSKSLIEVPSASPSEQDFVWTNLNTKDGSNLLLSYRVKRDELTVGAGSPLLTEYTINENIGDFGKSSIETSIVQTVATTDGSGIAFALANSSGTSEPTIITPDDEYNYIAHAVVQARDNNFIVLGSTNNHLESDNTARSDTDFFIKKIAFDGTDLSDGFTLKYGSTGVEEGARIVQADDDDGYVFVGTLRNTNDVELMVLVKINSKGELIN